MSETARLGEPVDPKNLDASDGGASEGDCLTPDAPDHQPTSDSPWWRSLQDALGDLPR